MPANAGLRPALACCQAVISSLPRARSAAGGETIRALCAAMSPPKTCPTGIDSPSERFIAPSGPRTPRGSSRKPKEGNAHEQQSKSRTSKSATRRKFLAGAALTGAAAVAMPQVSRAQTVTWKYQSTWPTKDIFHEFAVDYAKKVNDMSGGRLKLDVLAAGAVVPAFQMQDAVHSGVLDGGHGVSRLLVRQAQGVLAVRHPAVVRLGRARHARLVLLRRRRGALQRARQRHPQAQHRRLPLLPDADPAARLVQEAGHLSRTTSRT